MITIPRLDSVLLADMVSSHRMVLALILTVWKVLTINALGARICIKWIKIQEYVTIEIHFVLSCSISNARDVWRDTILMLMIIVLGCHLDVK